MTSLTASSIQWGAVPHVALERVRRRALFCFRSTLRMIVASVARLFEEVICLRSVCLVLPQILASCLFFRLNTLRVWREVVECVLRLMITPPVWAGIGWRFGCSALRVVEWRSGEGGSLPVSRREFSFDFLSAEHSFFCFDR